VQALAAVLGFDDLIALLLAGHADGLADDGFVLDDEDAAGDVVQPPALDRAGANGSVKAKVLPLP